MNELQFDKMAVDTNLAQEYLKKEKSLSDKSIAMSYYGSSKSIENMSSYILNGKLFTERHIEQIQSTKLDHNKFILPETRRKLKELSSRLKENANLIAQLEFLIRKIPIDDTNAQLNLIIQHLRCVTQLYIDLDRDVLPIIFNGPLLLFGNVIDVLSCVEGNLLVRATRETAIVSHLFVKLCHEVGLDSIVLEFVSDSDIRQKEEWNIIQGWHYGTVAIVSEDADVDSAVDTFISSSNQAPWYLRRILVQESIYQQFKDALTWKCNLEKQEYEVKISKIMCSETLTYNGREFLIDPVELSTDESVVTIEAYRTRKEVISFVQKDKPHFLSLWANGIAEINEITHSTNSSVVWVNSLADFRGPPKIAEAVYSNFKQLGGFKIKKSEKISKLCKLAQSWLQLDLDSRLDILLTTLDRCITSYPNNDIYAELKSVLTNCAMNSFVDVGKDYVCVGISSPVGIKAVDLTSETIFTKKNLKSLLYGNAFAIGYLDMPDDAVEVDTVYDILEQAGIPALYVGSFLKGDFNINKCNADTLNRVIWTNSGTIFAN